MPPAQPSPNAHATDEAGSARYRGRFAPSPTGPLHFGSLIAAVGSFLAARTGGGLWYVRMEDIDRPREVPGAAETILRQLEAFELGWDGPVVYQSRRLDAYHSALRRLKEERAAYPCACSRREIADSALPGIEGPVYPGTCRPGLPHGRKARAWRVTVGDGETGFVDLIQGTLRQRLDREVGDFVVYRADRIFAYQLAVVVDDAAQGISQVVRGADLLASTPRQIHLQRLLGLPTPSYAHLPVALDGEGAKLSKQTGALPVDIENPAPGLAAALRFLGHPPPAGLERARPRDLLEWSHEAWRLDRVPRQAACAAPRDYTGSPL